MKVTIEFKLQDLWIGAYWRYDKAYQLQHLYICLIPCIPIHITFDRTRREAKKLAGMIMKVRNEEDG